MSVCVKRIYEVIFGDDGYRVLVDRLWPRGIKKEDAQIDEFKYKLVNTIKFKYR